MRSLPLLVHVHVPKTAGTSFNRVLEDSFREKHLNLYASDPCFVYAPEQLDAILANRPEIVSLSSHSIRIFPREIGGRLPLYVCFVRNPLDQLLSNMSFIRKHYLSLSAEHRRNCPPRAHKLPVREIARWCLERNGRLNRLGHATHFLAEDHWKHVMGAADGYEARAPEVARQILDRFFFVGLTERFDKSLRLLNRALAPHGLRLNLSTPHFCNISRDVLADLRWVREDDAVGRMALDYVGIDVPLYRYARDRFSRHV